MRVVPEEITIKRIYALAFGESPIYSRSTTLLNFLYYNNLHA